MRAQYAILTIDEGLAEVHYKKVNYDVDREIQLAKQANLPYVELYQLQLETGKTHTHDTERLWEINQRFDYVRDVETFFAKNKQ